MTDELIHLSDMLSHTHLTTSERDSITWKLTNDGTYSARSAYNFQFEGLVSSDMYTAVWRSWAPTKCKIFLWMALQCKILTADVLLSRGWDNNYFCPLCIRSLETTSHLLYECPWSRKVWDGLAVAANLTSLNPQSWLAETTLREWFPSLTDYVMEERRKKGAKALAILICWELWLERNRRIFQQKELPVPILISRIRDEAATWKLAGCPIVFDPG
ncbi:hypothetical protein ZWY2020_029068 [Hordeum vulgare]|nr:hypothetical protein ZWY2020_029068 [Hordeum vulgare]